MLNLNKIESVNLEEINIVKSLFIAFMMTLFILIMFGVVYKKFNPSFTYKSIISRKNIIACSDLRKDKENLSMFYDKSLVKRENITTDFCKEDIQPVINTQPIPQSNATVIIKPIVPAFTMNPIHRHKKQRRYSEKEILSTQVSTL